MMDRVGNTLSRSARSVGRTLGSCLNCTRRRTPPDQIPIYTHPLFMDANGDGLVIGKDYRLSVRDNRMMRSLAMGDSGDDELRNSLDHSIFRITNLGNNGSNVDIVDVEDPTRAWTRLRSNYFIFDPLDGDTLKGGRKSKKRKRNKKAKKRRYTKRFF
jgi:hypothetical protein